MKHNKNTSEVWSAGMLGLLAFLACIAPGNTEAANFVKADNSTPLNTSGSWTSAGVPGSTDTALFDGTFSPANNSAPLGTNMAWAGIVVSNNLQSAFTINATGTNALTIGSGGINMTNANQSFTINSPVVLAANQNWAINGDQALTLGGPVTAMAGTPNISVNGTVPGTLNLLNAFTNTKTDLNFQNYSFNINIDHGPNAVFYSNQKLCIGKYNNALVTMNFLSGTNIVTPANYIILGDGNGNAAALNNGPGNGVMNVFNCLTILSNTTSPVVVGGYGSGTINVSNASLVIGCANNFVKIGGLNSSQAGTTPTGALNIMSNSTVVIPPPTGSSFSQCVDLGLTYTGTGSINLYNGCTLTTSRVITRGFGAASYGSGFFNFFGGTLKVGPFVGGNPVLFSNLTAVTLYHDIATIDDSGYQVSVYQPLLGDGGLNKVGSGTLAFLFDADNTGVYGGPTTISNGTLQIQGSGLYWGSFNVNSNATLAVVASGGGALLSSLALANGSSLTFNEKGATNPGSSPVLGSYDPVNTSGKVTINITNVIFSGSGQYPLIYCPSGFSGAGFNALALGSLPLTPGYSFSLYNNVASQTVDLIVSQNTTLVWDGTTSGVWDLNGAHNWKTGQSYAEAGGVGPAVTFDDTLSGSYSDITLNTTVHPSAVLFGNSQIPYSIKGSGSIAGTATIAVQSSGVVTLATANTATGTVLVNQGTLQLGDGVASNGSVGGNIINNAAVIVANPNSQTLTNQISGSGTLTKAGNGLLTLTSANSLTGPVAVNGGTLALSSSGTAAVLPSVPSVSVSNANLLLQGNGVLSSNASLTIINGSLSNSAPGVLTLGPLTLGVGATLDSKSEVNASPNLTIATNQVINAPLFVIKHIYNSTMTLPTNSSVTFSNALAFTSTPDKYLLLSGNGSTLNTYGNITNDHQLIVDGVTWNFDLGTNTFQTYGTKVTLGKTDNKPAVWNLYSGTIMNVCTDYFALGDSGNVTTPPSSSGTLNIYGGTMNINLGAQRVLFGNAGSASVNVSGGQLNFGGSNAFSIMLGGDTRYAYTNARGTMTISGTGSVEIGNNTLGLQLGANSSSAGTYAVNGVVGILNLYGGKLTTGPGITFAGGTNANGASSAGYVNFSGGLLRASTNNANFLNGLTLATVSTNGAIIDDGGFAITIGQKLTTDTNLLTDGGLTKLGSGTLSLTNANTYTGPTVISNGVLTIEGSLGTNSVNVFGGCLAGSGVENGSVKIFSGAAINPGSGTNGGVNTINGNLTLDNGAVLNFGLGNKSSQLQVNGNLVLGGTLNITELSGFSAGTYTLISYSGTRSGTSPAVGTVPPGYAAHLELGIPGQVNLVVTKEGNPPTITQEPASLVKYLTQSARFLVSATGNEPPSYQWEREIGSSFTPILDDSRVSGATSSSLAIANLALGDSGAYRVVITNTSGAITSQVVSLTVNPAPTIKLEQSKLSWPSECLLLESTNVTGPWTTNAGSSPFTINATESKKFYRLLAP